MNMLLSQMFGEKTSRERPFASLRVTLLEWCSGYHPERSEGSGSPDAEILRFAQDDRMISKHLLWSHYGSLCVFARGMTWYDRQKEQVT